MKRVFKYVAALCSFIGLLLILGTVGAMENDAITFAQGVFQSVIGLVIFCGGTLLVIGG